MTATDTDRVEWALTAPRVFGTLTVRFGRDREARREIRFGGPNYSPEMAELVRANGVDYYLCARLVEQSPGQWRPESGGYDVLRRPGQIMSRGTDNARRAVLQAMIAACPALAEANLAAFDEGAAQVHAKAQEDLAGTAADLREVAELLDRQAELAGRLAEGEALVRPWDGPPTRILWGPQQPRATVELRYGHIAGMSHISGRIDTVLDLGDGTLIGYVVLDRDGRQTLVPLPDVHSIEERR
jgi:hypothetical protein